MKLLEAHCVLVPSHHNHNNEVAFDLHHKLCTDFLDSNCYGPPMKLREGNGFSLVCPSVSQ